MLKLQAAYQALLTFHHLTKKSSVILRLDNTTAVAYIRRQGGIRSWSLLREVEPIINWAQKNLQHLSGLHTWDPDCASGLPFSGSDEQQRVVSLRRSVHVAFGPGSVKCRESGRLRELRRQVSPGGLERTWKSLMGAIGRYWENPVKRPCGSEQQGAVT